MTHQPINTVSATASADQPDFAPLHEAAYRELISEIQFTVTSASRYLAGSEQPDFSPLLVLAEKGKQ
jgi:hypothetical protein